MELLFGERLPFSTSLCMMKMPRVVLFEFCKLTPSQKWDTVSKVERITISHFSNGLFCNRNRAICFFTLKSLDKDGKARPTYATFPIFSDFLLSSNFTLELNNSHVTVISTS